MIQLKNISKIYGKDGQQVKALDNANISIAKGEFVAIVGASGSGKSTMMNILGMLDRPTSGEYYLENKEISTLTDDELAKIRNKKIGFVFQKFHLLPKTTAIENVELPLIYSDRKDIRKLAVDALAKVGLSNRGKHRTNELSGGQQQRVAIARALVNEPEVILGDEPTGNLDSKSGLEVVGVFQELNRSGKTIILITHSGEVAEHANRIIRIHDGKITEDYKVEKPLDARTELAELKKAIN
ncbi:MAG: macrolide ABC transporter ATP-binding protein [Stygiobacter sp. RIFOXYC12_FULL_38_8]|nr:MAG: macrolide ABC transporter ATP-binding protein [Stygiobacter sp. GWC2_38_9]OGU82996.1 MAG: macrolide ABC transporter ATP-binding protein [Stygiobacter sp. RIFOXYA12_FULL_38_9]OGV08346.1 MAG: macrolide ABC transporter ATP-binding protein [Stygiobacter sp. RIFOXYB2_FULL_37_11]OGV13934.1 MAG: macrolide ABC transporter ATP-binding protein [Stygiobacter sp. RIFOXYC2_FULL_38_25]OGV15406.1 MAG: macrolide ABC transporter ATP-binding protein [Stygiobacter sp. RIFOXYA2_FULL_38_8]OGV30519.1 MAG: m